MPSLNLRVGDRVFLDGADGRTIIKLVAVDRGPHGKAYRLVFEAPPAVAILREKLARRGEGEGATEGRL